MTESPSYPEDSPVGDSAGKPVPAPSTEGDKKPEGGRSRQIFTGAAIGVGSAALVAALLYANRSRKPGNKKP